MDRNRTVAGLDVHKDSIYLGIMGYSGSIIFEKTYGVLTPDLRQILIEISWVASRTRNCFFSNFSYIRTTVKKKSRMKIQVAIARKILVTVWHMLSKKEDFIDIYLKRLREQRKLEEQIKRIESTAVN